MRRGASSGIFALLAASWSLAAEAWAPRPVAPIPETIFREGKSVRLNIADRKHTPDAPKEGWCGENAIQQALLFHGAFVPQKLINQAGKPKHPDLHASEIPAALKALGVASERWPWRPRDFDKFFAWTKLQVEAGHPVLAGVKIYPTAHPEWGLDHFVLAIGYSKDSLVLNTTWGRQETKTTKELLTAKKGLAFRNRYSSYYGIGIAGFAGRGRDDVPVRLFVLREDKGRIEAAVKCERLAPGRSYRVWRFGSLEQKTPDRSFVFRAEKPVFAFHDAIEKKQPAIYRCRPAAE